MNDTPPEIEEKVREVILKKTPAERLKMGFAMFNLSKRLVANSLLQSNPNLSPAELKRELFLRFYGNDFNPKQRQEILERLA